MPDFFLVYAFQKNLEFELIWKLLISNGQLWTRIDQTKYSRILRTAKPPKQNFTASETHVVRNLNENKDMAIWPAEKGNAVVTMATRKQNELLDYL